MKSRTVGFPLRPRPFGTYMLIIAVLFAFLFLLAANYNFIHQASETLKTTKDNYGQALISQISTADAAWDSYVASLDGVGLQDIIAEYQTYVDENL